MNFSKKRWLYRNANCATSSTREQKTGHNKMELL